jgi:hypothetical protein
MKRRLAAILAAGMLVAPVWSPVSAQEVSRQNQHMDNRPSRQSEQTVAGHTSALGVNVQHSPTSPKSRRRRRPARASKTPPHFRVPAPDRPVAAN